jgi:hypothetical protein
MSRHFVAPRLVAALGFVAALMPGLASAGETGAALTGKTLNAVAYVMRREGVPSELSRFMFQAYLRAGGGALVRVWEPQRDAYTRPREGRWTLAGSTLCLDLRAGPGRVCADIHIWGPRLAGIGVSPYVMLDGDLSPGNVIAAGRR